MPKLTRLTAFLAVLVAVGSIVWLLLQDGPPVEDASSDLPPIVAKRAERGFVTDPVKLCVLLTEEVGELAALEKRRWSPNYPAPGVGEFAAELSDVLVTLVALAHAHDVDLESAVAEKFFGEDERRAWKTARTDDS